MKSRPEIESQIETRKTFLERTGMLCTEYQDKETAAQTTLVTLQKQLSLALARYALGETDHFAPEVLKCEISKIQTTLHDTPLIVQGLKTRADEISAEIRELQKQLSLISAQEVFDETKTTIITKANAGIVFKAEEGRLRQTAHTLGITVTDFIREMDKVRESRSLACQRVNGAVNHE